jgi:peptide chain release factor 2
MVKDLRTNFESTNPDDVLDGELNPFIKSYLMEFGQK